MKTKLFKFLKAKLAAWVLSDPSILIQNNNLSAIEEKYEVVTLSIAENAHNKLSLIDRETLLQIISCEFAKQIIEQKLFKIELFSTPSYFKVSNSLTSMIVSLKVLTPKNK
jgi:hypothetical protein